MKFRNGVKALALALLDALRGNYFYHSGALTYQFILSLIPMSVVALGFADLIPLFDPRQLEGIVEKLLPQYASGLVREVLEIRNRRAETSLLAFLTSYIFSVSLIRSMGKALFFVSGGIFGERKEILYWILMPLTLLMGSAVLLLSFALNLYLKFSLPAGYRSVIEFVYILPGSLLIFFLYLLFLKQRIPFFTVLLVSFLSSASLSLLQSLFTWYIAEVFRGNLLYGSLSSVVIFLLWMNLVFFVFLLGARLIYRIEETDPPCRRIS